MRRSITILVGCLVAAVCLHAQNARVSGTVTDLTLGAVRGCAVVMKNTATQIEVST
jgi:hypothetical protein